MVKMLTKSGNSLAIVLDKALLQVVQLDETTPVKIDVENGKLVLSPAPAGDRRKFEAVKAKMHQRYAKTFKRLAE